MKYIFMRNEEGDLTHRERMWRKRDQNDAPQAKKCLMPSEAGISKGQLSPEPPREVQFSCSVVSNSLDPIDCNMPGFPVYHQFPKFT